MSNEKFIYTLAVSYPRCGFGVTHNTIKDYFIKHPEVNNYIVCLPGREKKFRSPSNFCYSDNAPFKSHGVVLQKSHDFIVKSKWNIKKDTNTQYLLLYRNPLSSISSNYIVFKKTFNYYYRRLSVNIRDKIILNKDRNKIIESLLFEEFVIMQINKWNRFMTKWFFDDSIKILKIEYDDLIKNPFQNISKIIKYMAPYHEIDIPLLKETIIEKKFELKTNIEDYEFYNEKDFEKYELLTIWNKISPHSSF